MFFEKDLISFNLLDVLKLEQRNISKQNTGRNFSAISYRSHADTYLSTDTSEHHMTDNSVAYVPARLDYNRNARIDELIVIHFETTNYQTRSIETFMPQTPQILAGLFNEVYECWQKKELGYKYECSALLCRIFSECHIQNHKTETRASKIQNSVDCMLESYKNGALSISEIASRSFMSEVYFRKLFKEEYGISPQKYLIRLRIQNAVGLISTGYYSLKEVAYMSGYSDYKYFSSEFKKAMGISPSEYLYNYSDEAAHEQSGN